MIDFDSNETSILLNPRMPAPQRQKLEMILQFSGDFPGHFWLCTSGTHQLKLVALSKKAILISANAVNLHLSSDSSDIWVNPLPSFHVGGLGIIARAYLSGSKLFNYTAQWDPFLFYQILSDAKGSLTALVPAQMYDLIQADLASPKSVRGVIIGGGSLSPSLYWKALELGWKLLPSYGMTESSSQIATAELDLVDNYPRMKILPHMSVSLNDEGRVCLRSESLLSAYAWEGQDGWHIVDPKVQGMFLADDMGTVEGEYLQIIGRCNDFIKIGGESVHLQRLENLLEDLKLRMGFSGDLALLPMADERLGHVIHLAAGSVAEDSLTGLLEAFNQQVMPFEKIRKVHNVALIPRSPVGKVLKKEIQKALLG